MKTLFVVLLFLASVAQAALPPIVRNDYTTNTAPSLSGGRLEVVFTNKLCSIYIPSGAKWFELTFPHTTNSAISADFWTTDRVWLVDRTAPYTYTRGLLVVTNSTWLGAILVGDGTNFVSGYHGYETVTNAVAIWDGGAFDLQSAVLNTNITTTRLTILQNSSIFYEASTSNLVDHSFVFDFSPAVIKTSQQFRWRSATNLEHAYVAMFPASRTVSGVQMTDRAIIGPNYEIFDVSTNNFVYHHAILGSDISIWGLTSGFSARVKVTKWPGTDPLKRDTFIINSDPNYNKFYFDPVYWGGSTNVAKVNVLVDDVWETEAEFVLQRK